MKNKIKEFLLFLKINITRYMLTPRKTMRNMAEFIADNCVKLIIAAAVIFILIVVLSSLWDSVTITVNGKVISK